MSDALSTADPRALQDIQQWMQTVIMHPDGIPAGIVAAESVSGISRTEAEHLILPSSRQTSRERLQIYHRAYFGRLIECLRAQFPAVRHAVGDEAFDGLAFGFLLKYPSTSYTLDRLSQSFDLFLENTRPVRVEQLDFADFVIELARLERVYREVFNGRGPESIRSLQPADLEGLSAADFADCRLRGHECVRLMEFHFPVHEYTSSLRRGQIPLPPEPRPVLLVITRRNYVVRRYEVTRDQFELLTALLAQQTVGEALGRLSSLREDLTSLVDDIRNWFRDWCAAPLFAEVISGTPTDDANR